MKHPTSAARYGLIGPITEALAKPLVAWASRPWNTGKMPVPLWMTEGLANASTGILRGYRSRGSATLRGIIPLVMLGLLGCSLVARSAETAPAFFSENLSWGSVEIQLRAEPATVELARDLNVVLTVTAPAAQTVELPDLRGRFQGFTVAEGFPRDPVTLPDGRRSREYRWRLVPDVAREYRLAPFAVTVRDGSAASAETRSFATRSVVFPAALRDTSIAGDIELDPKPFWIAPTRRDIFGAAVLLGLIVVLIAFLVRLLLYFRRQVRLHRLSPRERAFVELERLLNRHWLEQGLFKDFYIELTQVVRRYIERAHGIRAPGQTTEEFLAAAQDHPRFSPSVLGRLREFLQSADLVKFAGQAANPQVAEASVKTARTYIEEDAASQSATPGEPGRGD